MVLRRVGNKARIAKDVVKHFPPHKIYIEPFFGAGGIYFNKPKAQYNFLNDLDDDVFNLFMVLKNQKQALIEYFEEVPMCESLFKHWVQHKETDAIPKAARFLYLSNLSYLGKKDTFRFGPENPLQILINRIIKYEDLNHPYFMNKDFKKVFDSITIRDKNDYCKTFIYNDPPYLATATVYSTDKWNEQDLIDLFEENMKMAERGAKFAISEFEHDLLLELVEKYNLEIINIGERQNLKNRRKEVMVVNYKSPDIYGLFGTLNQNQTT